MTGNWRQHFSIQEGLLYLNSGTMALSPNSVLLASQKAKQEIESNPAHALFSAWTKMWPVQKSLAQFLNADAKDLFLRPNVTYVMNDFILALNLPPQSEILISNLEYGAIVNICKHKAALEGHTLRTFALPARGPDLENLTEDGIVEIVEKALSTKTRLLMLSHVLTGSGLILPIEKIAELCRRKNVIFAVDGAHGAGSISIDFSNSKMHFYGSNLHKWMMGPKGTGFGWIAKDMRDQLTPKFAGWTSYDVADHFKTFGEGDLFTARWMICSTHNFADFYAIQETIQFWKTQGFDNILSQQRELKNYLIHKVSEVTALKPLLTKDETLRGPMVAFELPEKTGNRAFEFLFYLRDTYQLQVSMTMIDHKWCLRLAPHIYNTHDEINRAAAILKKYSC